MGKIPIATTPQLSSGNYGGFIQARSNANFQATYNSPANLPDFSGAAKGLQDIASAVIDYQDKLDTAEANSQIRLADAKDNAAVTGFMDSLQQRNDYDNFQKEWDGFSEKFQTLDEKTNPRAAKVIKENRQILLQKGMINLKRTVNAKRLDKMRGDQQYLIEGAVNAGDLEGVKKLYTSGHTDGIFSNQEMQKGIANAEGDIQKAQIQHALMSGNIRQMKQVKKDLMEKGEKGYLNYTAIDANSRLSLVAHVDRAEKAQRDAYAKRLQHILNDPTAKDNDKFTAVIEMENKGVIDTNEANKMKHKILYPKNKFTAADYKKVENALKMYRDEKIDRVKMLETISSANLTAKDETFIRTRMNEIDDPESPENKYEFKSATNIINNTYEKMRPDIQDPDGFLNKKSDEETEFEVAKLKREAVNRVKEFIKSNPQAKLDEVESFAKTIVKPEMKNITADSFRTAYAAKKQILNERGKTAYNPKTGETLIFKDGKWTKQK